MGNKGSEAQGWGGCADVRAEVLQAGRYARRARSGVRYLVVHHAGFDYPGHGMRGRAVVDSIARHHVGTLGWPGIGYHFVVTDEGEGFYVGDVETMRWNVARRNHEVVGICVAGDYRGRRPSAAALARARGVLAALRALFPGAQVVGHKEIALPGTGTACPGDTWEGWRGEMERDV